MVSSRSVWPAASQSARIPSRSWTRRRTNGGAANSLITASHLLLSGVALLVLVLAPSDRLGDARIAFAAVLVYTGYAVLAALHA